MKPALDILQKRLRAAFSRPRLSVDLLSDRTSRIFPRAMSEALPRYFDPRGVAITLRELRHAPVPSHADIVLLQCHVRKAEPAYLTELRRSGYAGVIVAWFWDNHHAKDNNRRVAELVDVGIAAHDCHAHYLAEATVLLRSVMLCTTQWTDDEARAFSASLLPLERRPDLFGGFYRYKGSARTALLDDLIATGQYPSLRFVDGDDQRPGYHELPSEVRFREWAQYAVSLCLPYRNDLSQRFFDAWLTGQVPVVAPDIADLKAAWALEHRDRHFVCAAGYERREIDAAHRRALELFAAGGLEARRARNRIVLERHLLHHRIGQILDLLRQAATDGFDAVTRPPG